jgi:hypothetical protein
MGVEPFACLVLPTEAGISTSQTSLPVGVHNKESAWPLRRELLTTPLGVVPFAHLGEVIVYHKGEMFRIVIKGQARLTR